MIERMHLDKMRAELLEIDDSITSVPALADIPYILGTQTLLRSLPCRSEEAIKAVPQNSLVFAIPVADLYEAARLKEYVFQNIVDGVCDSFDCKKVAAIFTAQYRRPEFHIDVGDDVPHGHYIRFLLVVDKDIWSMDKEAVDQSLDDVLQSFLIITKMAYVASSKDKEMIYRGRLYDWYNSLNCALADMFSYAEDDQPLFCDDAIVDTFTTSEQNTLVYSDIYGADGSLRQTFCDILFRPRKFFTGGLRYRRTLWQKDCAEYLGDLSDTDVRRRVEAYFIDQTRAYWLDQYRTDTSGAAHDL